MSHPAMPTAAGLPALEGPWSRWLAKLLAVAALLAAAGCATPPPAAVPASALPFEQAVAAATDALAAQLQTVPAVIAKLNKRAVVLDPSLDASSGQQTLATQALDRRVAERLGAAGVFEMLPFRAANLSKAQLLWVGTLTREAAAFRLNMAIVDLKTGQVAAQSSALARGDGVDMSPLAYYRDSPVLVKDKVIDGYVRTASTKPPERGDATYLERIATAAVINDAMLLYSAERYEEALGQYRSALATPAGEQMRVLNGIYLTNWKLGRMAEAEAAFGRVVAFGIGARELGVKFLFNPGGTEFWSDTKVSGAYAMWLRQIAKEGAASKTCMDLVGHTSKSGTEQFNDGLSLKRAAALRQRLAAESADFGARLRPQGMGFRQNLVGSGSDDAVDALDRRVEFRIVPCGG